MFSVPVVCQQDFTKNYQAEFDETGAEAKEDSVTFWGRSRFVFFFLTFSGFSQNVLNGARSAGRAEQKRGQEGPLTFTTCRRMLRFDPHMQIGLTRGVDTLLCAVQ